MKKVLSSYKIYYMQITIVIIMTISFGIGQDWRAMIWAFLASFSMTIALLNLKQADAIRQ